MPAPIEVTSVAQWEAALSDAKAAGRTVFVDFHAEWCVPCKSIAPYFALLAAQYPGATWLRVDIEGEDTKPIGTEYKVTMMPSYFLAIRDGAVAGSVRGADPRALTALAAKYGGGAPAEAKPAVDNGKEAEERGNTAFLGGDYAAAVGHYTEAIAAGDDVARLG